MDRKKVGDATRVRPHEKIVTWCFGDEKWDPGSGASFQRKEWFVEMCDESEKSKYSKSRLNIRHNITMTMDQKFLRIRTVPELTEMQSWKEKRSIRLRITLYICTDGEREKMTKKKKKKEEEERWYGRQINH